MAGRLQPACAGLGRYPCSIDLKSKFPPKYPSASVNIQDLQSTSGYIPPLQPTSGSILDISEISMDFHGQDLQWSCQGASTGYSNTSCGSLLPGQCVPDEPCCASLYLVSCRLSLWRVGASCQLLATGTSTKFCYLKSLFLRMNVALSNAFCTLHSVTPFLQNCKYRTVCIPWSVKHRVCQTHCHTLTVRHLWNTHSVEH